MDKYYNMLDPFDMTMLDLRDMELFGHYLTSMEAFLETESQKCHQRIEAIMERIRSGELAAPSDPGQMPSEIQGDYYWRGMIDGFANILRRSFFLNLYACLESRLVEECYCRDKQWCDAIPERYRRSDKLTKAMQYLIQVQCISFSLGESKEWGEIHGDYRRLRNCIAHNEGRLNEQFSERSKLEKYVDQKPTLTLSAYDDEIILGKDFCEEVFDTVREFLLSVLIASRKWLQLTR